MKRILWMGMILGIAGSAWCQSAEKVTAPAFTNQPRTRVSIDSTYSCTFTAMDSAGRSLQFSLIRKPSWLDYDPSTKTLSGTPPTAGQYPIGMEVTNGLQSATQHFMLTVFNKRTVSILPLGNSITNGTDRYNSYRRPLWQVLHEQNYNFDMIGSWDKHHMGGPVPDPDFDMDHDGHSGWNSADVLHPPDWDERRGSLSQWLKNYSPDIVLIELGTNDIFQCKSPDELFRNFTSIIATLRQGNGRIKIFIGTIIPLGPRWNKEMYCGTRSLGETLQAINAKLSGFCTAQSTRQSKVVLVDLFSAIDPVTQMYDDIHPNTEGEKALARVWLEAIRREVPKL